MGVLILGAVQLHPMDGWALSGSGVQTPWHDVLGTVWLLCDKAQQVGCLQRLEGCPAPQPKLANHLRSATRDASFLQSVSSVGGTWVTCPALLRGIWARSRRAGFRCWSWLSAHVWLRCCWDGRLLTPLPWCWALAQVWRYSPSVVMSSTASQFSSACMIARGIKTDAFTWPSLLQHFSKCLLNLSTPEQPLLPLLDVFSMGQVSGS